ncbi:hypothetical protein [Caudoviricetes sp.]|nr:hypothetical protein [Caudoviricetes sp.]
MVLEQELRKIFQLEDDTLLFDEAKKKLIGTIMLVNGVPITITSFNWETDEITGSEWVGMVGNKKWKVKTLQTYLPEAGLYPLSTGQLLLVTKHPKRQWYKSYHSNYYVLKLIGSQRKGVEDKVLNHIREIYKKERKDIHVDGVGDIYYFSLKIGYILNKKHLVCTNKNFVQELIDWLKE